MRRVPMTKIRTGAIPVYRLGGHSVNFHWRNITSQAATRMVAFHREGRDKNVDVRQVGFDFTALSNEPRKMFQTRRILLRYRHASLFAGTPT